MSEAFFGALSPMLVMFLLILAGYMLNKLKLLPNDTAKILSNMEKYLFMPAVGYANFSKYCTTKDIVENIDIVFYSMIAIAFVMCISVPLSRIFEKNEIDKRNVYKYVLTFANHGFMGNAIVPLVLGGEEHLYKYLLFTLPLNFMTYLWGINVLTPKKYRCGNMIKGIVNPSMIAMLLGIIAGVTRIQRYMPQFIITAVDSLQKCMGPVAMLLTGFVIGGYNFKELLTDIRIYIVTALRLLILPAIIILLLCMLGANDYIITLALFAFATPCGLNSVVFPASFGGDTKPGAGMAMVSHILCVITIPLMYGIIQLII